MEQPATEPRRRQNAPPPSARGHTTYGLRTKIIRRSCRWRRTDRRKQCQLTLPVRGGRVRVEATTNRVTLGGHHANTAADDEICRVRSASANFFGPPAVVPVRATGAVPAIAA